MFTGISTIGIPWYEAEHWDRLRNIFPDADDLPILYDDWVNEAERKYKLAGAQGVRVFRAIVNPDAFAAWCSAKKLVNAKNRKRYVAEGALLNGRSPV